MEVSFNLLVFCGILQQKNNCPLDLEYVDFRGQFLQEIEGPMCGALWRSMWHGTESIQGPMWQPRPDITTAAF